MPSPPNVETEQLLNRAADGDDAAVNELMVRHRQRLQRMVVMRMDQRLVRRIDPSDVVQETLVEAAQRLPQYLKLRPIPFYPWLRQIAWNRLVDLFRFHIKSAKRSIRREAASKMGISDESVAIFAGQLTASSTTPSRNVARQELREQVRAALGKLPDDYREVLVLRHLEQLSIKEIAVIVRIAEGTVKSRLFRGTELLHDLLGDLSSGADT